jgi:leucyl aminopeptidase (aminopeptidase T)
MQQNFLPEAVRQGCEKLVLTCAGLEHGEAALIISDENTQAVGEAVAGLAHQITDKVKHYIIPPLGMHGQEPPQDAAADMIKSNVAFGLTRMSMAHSQARFRASHAGLRYLSLPDYSMAVLSGPALRADFRSLTSSADRLAELLTSGRKISLRTTLGTDITCNIKGRKANAAPGWCYGPGTLASPPNAETNIAVIEDDSYGTLVVDGSIPYPGLGLLPEPVTLVVENGRIVRFSGWQEVLLKAVFDRTGDPAARVIAEFGIGLNPLAELRGRMLEDEGCLGTVHLGVGSNATIGGQNNTAFHLDFIVRSATVAVDGHTIISNGKFVKEILT